MNLKPFVVPGLSLAIGGIVGAVILDILSVDPTELIAECDSSDPKPTFVVEQTLRG